jgi:hypothetical protein
MLPTFKLRTPHIYPETGNRNMGDDTTYLKNGTEIMLLNKQQNFINKISGLPKMYLHGDGTARKGMWGKGSDQFQFVIAKMNEE